MTWFQRLKSAVVENGVGAECHRQGKEVEKYRETGLHIVDLSLFIGIVDTKRNIAKFIF